MKFLKIYINFLKRIYKESKLFVWIKVFLAIIQGVFPVFNVLMPKYIIDSILIKNSIQYFCFYVILFILVQIIISAIYSIIDIFVNNMLIKINASITCDMLDKLYKMSYEQYDNPESFNTINRAFQFTSGAGINSFDVFIKTFATLITAFSYIYIIASFNWVILLIISVGILVNYFIMHRKTKINFNFNNKNTIIQRKSDYFKSVLLNKFLARDLRINDNYYLTKEAFKKNIEIYNKNLFIKDLKLFGFDQVGGILQNLITLSIMISFGLMLLNKQITVGDYTVSLNTAMQFNGVIFSLIGSISSIYGSALESTNYSNFLHMADLNNEKRNQNISNNNSNKIIISLKNVSFQYLGQDKLALNNFSYDFISGNTYSILGSNGSGKSTLIKLILGLYTPQQGNIYINGIDICDINLQDLYCKVSAVFQDFQFVDGISIKDNLIVNSEGNINLIQNKIEDIGLENKFMDFQNDINKEFSKTFNKNGLDFSGGEKQKLANIRAIMKSGSIIILDEPTSALDCLSEEKLFAGITDNNQNKIILYITHNPEMSKYSNKILILNNGELIEEGSYAELKEKSKYFNEIIN